MGRVCLDSDGVAVSDSFDDFLNRLAEQVMGLPEFERRMPRSAAELVRLAGGKGNVLTILPDEDDHCEYSALCQDQPGPRGMQLPGRRDRIAMCVRGTHPSLEGQHIEGTVWVWEDDL